MRACFCVCGLCCVYVVMLVRVSLFFVAGIVYFSASYVSVNVCVIVLCLCV